jgi:hypothetical protein
MIIDDFAVRVPIWLALIAYGVAVGLNVDGRPRLARRWWTIGCLAYLIHVAFAFQTLYLWSHQVAWDSTLDRTAAITGIETGVGLYVNYLFTLVWVVDAAYWWRAGTQRYDSRSRWITVSIHLFFLFMVFNGAIVFASGPARWLGFLVVAYVLARFALASKRRLRADIKAPEER